MPPAPHTAPGHRRDIDGLRGLAVLLVVVFHAQLHGRLFPGGFIGVDVFFVISGNLITGLMLRDLERGSFSLADFWERRARRILPALVVMVLAVLAVGTWLMLPEDLGAVGRSAVAQALMVANVHFWSAGGGYFAGPAEEMPLLHMWSLAVEEQFYLLMPFLCLGLAAWRGARGDLRGFCLRVFSLLFALSLAVSVVMVRQDAHWAFYWLPSRAWEMLLGALLACAPDGGRLGRACEKWHGWVAAASLGIIVVTGMIYGSSTPFPGLAALPPCLAAAGLLWAGGVPGRQKQGLGSLALRALESRPMRHLGLISYSLYLWHWPLLAFLKYVNPQMLTHADPRLCSLAAVLLAWALAVLSWRWVETPVRARSVLPARRALAGAAVGGIALVAVLGSLLLGGLPDRVPEKALNYARTESAAWFLPEEADIDRKDKVTRFGTRGDVPTCVMLWGDSHAKSVVPALEAWCVRTGTSGLIAAYPATLPMLGFHRTSRDGLNERSQAWAEGVLEVIRTRKIPHTVVTAYWKRGPGSRPAEFSASLVGTVRALRATGTRVWIVLDVPAQDFLVGKALALHEMHPALLRDPRGLGIRLEQHRRANSVLEAAVPALEQAGARVLDPAPLLFDTGGTSLIALDDQALYKDGDHISYAGVKLLEPLFAPIFSSEKAE